MTIPQDIMSGIVSSKPSAIYCDAFPKPQTINLPFWGHSTFVLQMNIFSPCVEITFSTQEIGFTADSAARTIFRTSILNEQLSKNSHTRLSESFGGFTIVRTFLMG